MFYQYWREGHQPVSCLTDCCRSNTPGPISVCKHVRRLGFTSCCCPASPCCHGESLCMYLWALQGDPSQAECGCPKVRFESPPAVGIGYCVMECVARAAGVVSHGCCQASHRHSTHRRAPRETPGAGLYLTSSFRGSGDTTSRHSHTQEDNARRTVRVDTGTLSGSW